VYNWNKMKSFSKTLGSPIGSLVLVVLCGSWLLHAGHGLRGDTPRKAPKKSDSALIGKWAAFESKSGSDLIDNLLSILELRVDKYKLRFVFPGATSGTDFAYSVNETTNPKQIDYASKGRVFRGIYKIEGDTLYLCICKRIDKPRPASFDGQKNNGEFWQMKLKKINP